MKLRVGLVIASLFLALFASGQTSGSSPASVSVPPVIEFSNVATDESGRPLTGTLPITFSLYNNAQGGEALWTETQSVTLDSSGHYNVYLGITNQGIAGRLVYHRPGSLARCASGRRSRATTRGVGQCALRDEGR